MARKPNKPKPIDQEHAPRVEDAAHVDPVIEILAAGLIRLVAAVPCQSAEHPDNLPASSPASLELPRCRALSVTVGEQADGKAGAA